MVLFSTLHSTPLADSTKRRAEVSPTAAAVLPALRSHPCAVSCSVETKINCCFREILFDTDEQLA
jgi:hypothetical protein